MRFNHLPWIGLALMLNGLPLSTSHPVGQESPKSSIHESVWSEKEFLDTLNDYFISTDNLEKSKAIRDEDDKDQLSSQGSVFYPQQVLPSHQQQQQHHQQQQQQQQLIIQQQQRQVKQQPSYQQQQQQLLIEQQQRQLKQQEQQIRQQEQLLKQQQSRIYEQWSDYPKPSSQIPRAREVASGESHQSSQVVAPPLSKQNEAGVVVYRLPEQVQTPTVQPQRPRNNRQKQRESRQRFPSAGPLKIREILDYDPLGLDNPLVIDDDEVVVYQNSQQQRPPQGQSQRGLGGRPQVFLGQPQQELLAQPQTLVPHRPQVGGRSQSHILIAHTPSPLQPRPSVPLVAIPISTIPETGPSPYVQETIENEVEKPNLMGQLGTLLETGKKIMYLPRGFIDVVDQAMSYAEKNPVVGFVMDKVADKLFGSTKGSNPIVSKPTDSITDSERIVQ